MHDDLLEIADALIAAFKASPLKDRRAFSAFILFRMRKD
jgi:hypothetical protein